MPRAITVRHDEADHLALRKQAERQTTLWTLDGALERNAADVGLPVKLVA
ncbi:MAG: hypothetical protein M3Y48_10085 [Actinomycetota bacterium]|nr:hypothetical protein [Actinomycetota bacterium]